jgi:hypothetical protein
MGLGRSALCGCGCGLQSHRTKQGRSTGEVCIEPQAAITAGVCFRPQVAAIAAGGSDLLESHQVAIAAGVLEAAGGYCLVAIC